MKIYFLSSIPCALTLNGVFFGVTDGFERFAEIDLRDNVFVSFSPENAQPVSFFLSENIRTQAPSACEVYLLRDGIAVYAFDFAPVDCSLRLISQQRKGDLLATVYAQGRVQLTVNSPEGFFNATLPPSFSNCEIVFHGEFILLRAEKELAVFTKKAECLLCEKALDFSLDGEFLHARLPLLDSLDRIADCTWRLFDGKCTQTQFVLQARSAAENQTQTLEKLLPYAFFESVLLGVDHAQFLCDELRENAPSIRDFLGNFTAVTLTGDPRRCGLVYPKAERLFELRYFDVEMENGKITDVKTAK